MLRVKEICRERGMTVSSLASKLGVKAPALSRIINGGNTTLETMERIATALEIPIQELFAAPNSDFYGVVVYMGVTYRIDSVEALQELCRIAEKDTNV